MIVRFLLALLAACLSLPATAAPACHTPSTTARHQHHAPREREPATPAHVCIGCVPIADWLRAPIAAPILPPALPPAPRADRLDLGETGPPALPPPRMA